MIAVHDVGDLSRMGEYNQIEVDSQGRITFFEEKPERARTTLAGVALYYYPRHALPLVGQYLDEGNNETRPAGSSSGCIHGPSSTPGCSPATGTTSARRRPSRKPTASFRRAAAGSRPQ